MGWHAQATAGQFRRLPRAGRQPLGAKAKASGCDGRLNGGRLNIAAAALGAAQAALDKALAYMNERKASAKARRVPGAAIQDRRHGDRTAGARIFLYQAAWKLDRRPDATKYCAMAKRLVTDTAFRVANEALQIHGGYGYLRDFGIEKIVRDLRVHQISKAPTRSCA